MRPGDSGGHIDAGRSVHPWVGRTSRRARPRAFETPCKLPGEPGASKVDYAVADPRPSPVVLVVLPGGCPHSNFGGQKVNVGSPASPSKNTLELEDCLSLRRTFCVKKTVIFQVFALQQIHRPKTLSWLWNLTALAGSDRSGEHLSSGANVGFHCPIFRRPIKQDRSWRSPEKMWRPKAPQRHIARFLLSQEDFESFRNIRPPATRAATASQRVAGSGT